MPPALFTFGSTLQGTESPRDVKEPENGGCDLFYPPSGRKNAGKKPVQRTKQHRKVRVPINRKRDKGVKGGFKGVKVPFQGEFAFWEGVKGWF